MSEAGCELGQVRGEALHSLAGAGGIERGWVRGLEDGVLDALPRGRGE